jgi:hypothetical protein
MVLGFKCLAVTDEDPSVDFRCRKVLSPWPKVQLNDRNPLKVHEAC